MVSTSKPNVVDEVAEEMGAELRTVRRAMVRRSGITATFFENYRR